MGPSDIKAIKQRRSKFKKSSIAGGKKCIGRILHGSLRQAAYLPYVFFV
jgi:hypothetical protein